MEAQQQHIAVATDVEPQPLPPFAPLTEWGIFGAVGYLLVQQALGWFREKETSESSLISSLIANQQRVLERLMEIQERQHSDLVELKNSITGFGERVERSVELQNQAIAQIQQRLGLLRKG